MEIAQGNAEGDSIQARASADDMAERTPNCRAS